MNRVWVKFLVVVASVASMQGMWQRAGADPPDWLGGQSAIERLAGRLPAVAARNGLSVAELRSHLLTDDSLRLDARDQLVYIDPIREGSAAADTTWLDATPAKQATFTEHSKPGSTRVVYLDFDGHTISGTAWNTSTSRKSCYTGPYNADGVSGFSSTERASIYDIWKRVAEDYAPFDVDVTLQEPTSAAITRSSSTDATFGTRALITNSTTNCANRKTLYASVCPGGCGGVAYVGVFDQFGTGKSSHSYYQPALIFQNGTGSGSKYVAEAVSHEVGHNLGLSHDGTAAVGYYQGHGSWAPIMGVGYFKAITQWSKGEYAGANNKQDDFVVMGLNGAGGRLDESSSELQTGSPLTGVISSAIDVDEFSLTVADGQTATIVAVAAPTSPDLDIALSVSGPAGPVASNDPGSGSSSDDAATGMSASIAGIPAGTYTITVDGAGFASPLDTGYSDYASVGGYTIVVTTTT